MTVSVSRFFRDRKLWVDLEKEILPQLLAGKKETLKVWSAGCARGEEVYSFMIIWDRLENSLNQLPKLEFIATDMHLEYIQMARKGIFTKSSLKEVTDGIRDAYFETKKGGNRFDVKSLLKENITWQVRNICSGPPETGFHIIFLRNNLLTYYRYHLIKKPLSMILKSLNPGGWLIIGSHEKLPDEESLGFTRNPATPWAYCKDIYVGAQMQ
jgi:chemotaxis methyl-accepting protein methylase